MCHRIFRREYRYADDNQHIANLARLVFPGGCYDIDGNEDLSVNL